MDNPHTVEFADTTGQYGTFTVDAEGKWSYTLDNSLQAVQALNDGETLTETFEYTVKDADGDESTATLTITINGQTDAPPVIEVEDADADASGADNSVVEGSSETVTGTVTVSAEAGVSEVTVGGQSILDLANNPVSITTTEGTLKITGYDAATGVITYEYTENG